jgi:DNA-binding Xre family transcriptional regulator
MNFLFIEICKFIEIRILRECGMITYQKLWETMKEKNITQYSLIHKYHVSAGQLSRLRANRYVNLHTIDMLCNILKCNIEDIVTFFPDNSDESG